MVAEFDPVMLISILQRRPDWAGFAGGCAGFFALSVSFSISLALFYVD